MFIIKSTYDPLTPTLCINFRQKLSLLRMPKHAMHMTKSLIISIESTTHSALDIFKYRAPVSAKPFNPGSV
jgi:hypothetical protein